MNRYKQLLTYIRSAVTRNYSEKSINSILDYISTSKQVRIRMLLHRFPDCVANVLSCTWLKTNKKNAFCLIDGPAPGVLRNHFRSFERCKKWQTVVQNKHKGTHQHSIDLFNCRFIMHLMRGTETKHLFLYTVGEAVPGERRIWEIAKDPQATSSVMPGNKVHFFHPEVFVRAVHPFAWLWLGFV